MPSGLWFHCPAAPASGAPSRAVHTSLRLAAQDPLSQIEPFLQAKKDGRRKAGVSREEGQRVGGETQGVRQMGPEAGGSQLPSSGSLKHLF